MNDLANHAAVLFGEWLKCKRRTVGITARVFAGRVRLSPAEYGEVEFGVVSWIGEAQETLIPLLLNLNDDEQAEFNHKLYLAREARPLSFGDLFTEDQLAPVRCSTTSGAQIDREKRRAILDAVFTPLRAA
jgi:hypothetical protein